MGTRKPALGRPWSEVAEMRAKRALGQIGQAPLPHAERPFTGSFLPVFYPSHYRWIRPWGEEWGARWIQGGGCRERGRHPDTDGLPVESKVTASKAKIKHQVKLGVRGA